MSPSVFWKTVIAGFIATFVMTMAGFWAHGVGIRTLDFGAYLASSMTVAHPETPYYLFAGNLAHFANGVILALLWVAFIRRYVPGSWLLHGLAYAVGLTVLADLIVFPLIADVGVFFTRMRGPGSFVLESFIMHLAYGFTLTLGLELAGIGAARAARDVETVRLEIWPRRERRRAS